MSDKLHRFLFEEAAVRGELVQLDESWGEVLGRHDYPPRLRHLLGQTLAAGALLAATLKFNGSITLQVRGDGPVSLLVVDVTSERTLRGVAHWKGEVPEGTLREVFGNGQLAITIEPQDGKRYQGIVALEGDSLADAIDDYLQRSEQLATRMWLAADGEHAAGLLLQRLPRDKAASEAADEGWERLVALSSTITDEELLKLEEREILHRLFHEEDLRLFEAESMRFSCSCSRERVANALRGLGREEVMDIIAERETVDVNCEFCNAHYGFDAVDAERLFTSEEPEVEVPPTRH